ncbi:MAG: bifunctional DNA-formamidopyrimidine glycosylase/DNA-(apurinic or apyrimidinic site) lyase [Phycisphaeraceae bacterium]
MPELPEVENVRMTLARHLLGRRVVAVDLRRADVVTGSRTPAALLQGQRIARLTRHGKQLAIVGDTRCLCVHLGMSGSLQIAKPHHHINPLESCATAIAGDALKHVHALWQFDDGSTLEFRDPRRFGGLWTFASEQALHATRWAGLGEDALRITPARLHRQLQATRRPLKAALLDQTLVAGLGNIYVDELLFTARLPPLRPAYTLTGPETASLVRHMRTLLARAIAAGGSTLRDYVNGEGDPGGYQFRHRVYGRAGLRCRRRHCRGVVHTRLIAGRTTASCPRCQPDPTSARLPALLVERR